MNPTAYFSRLFDEIGQGWNRFWFTPAASQPLGLLRLLTGLAALYYIASFTGGLTEWFGPGGLLPRETVQNLPVLVDPDAAGRSLWRVSWFQLTDDPTALLILHGLGLAAAAAMTLGLVSRVSTLATLVAVLSYVHRAPMIEGLAEPVLTMLLAYLVLAPVGAWFSLDRFCVGRLQGAAAGLLGPDGALWLCRLLTGVSRLRPGDPAAAGGASLADGPTWTANVAIRLIQLHLAAFYLTMGFNKLAGDPWWNGEAMWWLIAHSESRLVDLTWLHANEYLINFWTHAVVAFELGFGLFIWNRHLRPLLLIASVPMWLLLALVTGHVLLGAVMVIAGAAFLDPALFACCTRAPEESAKLSPAR